MAVLLIQLGKKTKVMENLDSSKGLERTCCCSSLAKVMGELLSPLQKRRSGGLWAQRIRVRGQTLCLLLLLIVAVDEGSAVSFT